MTSRQFSTFKINNSLYGIEVDKVQEISNTIIVTRVPLAPDYILGLINLRGQIATAIDLRSLFQLKTKNVEDSSVNVVCKIKGVLLSFMVDEISDVLELHSKDFEETPENIDPNVSLFMDGVYKLQDSILSVLNVDKIYEYINKKEV